MKPLHLKQVPTTQIKPLAYVYRCATPDCDNIIATSNEPFPRELAELFNTIPCSQCKNPWKYALELMSK